MSKKTTVTVTWTWFSSNPVFDQVIEAIKCEMAKPEILDLVTIANLNQLPGLNDGEPLTGGTVYGPHTLLTFEAPSLEAAVEIVSMLEKFLKRKFPAPENFQKMTVRYGGRTLSEAIGMLEVAVIEAQSDVKITRRLFPSRKLQGLRVALDTIRR